MISELYTINGEITCELSSGIEDKLKDIALSSSCDFKYKIIYKTSKSKTLDFEFEGINENIKKAKEYLEFWNLETLQESLSLIFKKYKVKNLNEEMLKGQFNISVNVNKFSRFINLAQAVISELDITAQMTQKNKGFLQGKDVNVKAFGNPKELKAFKSIMESFMTIEDSPPNKQIKI
jgi:hypothetical protein